MSENMLVREARRRKRIFENLDRYLQLIKEIVRKIDPNAEIYLLGSVVDGKQLYSSNIDILVITVAKPEEVITALWKRGIGDPFEIHVRSKEYLETYRRRSRLVRIR